MKSLTDVLSDDGCELSKAIKDLRERAAEIPESEMSEPFSKAIALLVLCNDRLKSIDSIFDRIREAESE